MLCSGVATLAISLADPAFAQVADTPTPDTPAPEVSATATATASSEKAEIVVVGSLIRRNQFNSIAPVQIIGREEAVLAGFNSTTEVLQGTSVTNGSAQINNYYGNYVTDGGPGANTIGLRGLGPSRTLVMINGHRVAPSGTRGSVGSADLNVLPTAIVSQIEVLKDGASSIYGSDAVAGVIDIITDKKLDGFDIEGQTDAPTNGGGEQYRVSLVAGYQKDRLKLSGSVEYYHRNTLTLADRDWTLCNTDYMRTGPGAPWGSADFVDPLTGKPKCYPITSTGSNGVTINAVGTSTVAARPAAGAVGTTFNRLRPNAAVTTGVVGYEGVGGGANNLNVRDTFDPRTLLQPMITPVTVYTGFFQGSYDTDILGHAEIYSEVLVNRRESAGDLYRQLTVDYPKGSPLIPANLAFSSFSGPTPITNGQNVGVRAFIGFGLTHSSQKSDFFKTSGGLRGDFFLPDWRYNFYASYTWTDASYTSASFLTSRVAKSLDVVSTGGVIACRVATDGCVPAPVMTPAVVGGQLPAAWSSYIVKDVKGKTKFDESLINFTVDGPVFDLPYGALQAVVGFEYRHDKIDDTPPIESQTGDLYNLTSATITRGSDEVWEAFGEVEVPLVREVPLIYDLTLNGSGRYTHYRSYGGDKTYKFQGRYAPVKWLSLRATYGTSYRAPALFEQFLGATSGFVSSTNDPCNNYNAPNVSPIRKKNCASEGLPAGFTATSSVTVLTQGGATANLKAETSKNLTAGVIFEPELGSFGNLSVAVDYFRIRVDNGVDRAGYSAILPLCYDNPNFRAGGSYCNLIDVRNPSSQALTIHDSYINLSTNIVRGIDYTVRFEHKFADKKSLVLRADVTKFLEQSSRLFSTDPLTDYNGMLSTPKWSGTAEAILQLKKWKFRYGIDWVGKTDSYDYYEEDPATSMYLLKTPNYFRHSLSMEYLAKNFTMTVGVRNLTDKIPPSISSGVVSRVGNAPLYSGYDYFGRTAFVNFTGHF